ncbi:proline racemase family protein [Sedimentibacter sp. zth1]|uniref:proline racemase family protein n=1 Tax=Sedimentibacter sp. zth1 TaxID=2816908 RepID=UPI001A922E5F|nr:proline racemase family protein [Sedimentibacter sp. zth1]QSX05960.1 proline racemase family protein [Sedimentibacter sp. zth1]
MIIKKSLQAIDSHTMGEPTRIITSGIPKIHGKTMAEKKQYLAKKLDYIRTAVMNEPRGHNDMFGSILMEPISDDADFGIVFMDGGGYLNMCGHGSIGAASAIVETGMVDVVEPITKVVLESPAGLIKADVRVENDKVKEATITNVPSFLYKRDLKINVPEVGEVTLDISFGGSFFAIVSIEQPNLNFKICPENSQMIKEIGIKIRDEVNKSIIVSHPYLTHIKTVDLVEFYGPSKNPKASLQNVVVFGAGQVDRSPCGTGTSAKIATLFSKGILKINEEFVYESITGTLFKAKAIDEIKVGEYNGIVPQITGKAYITGFNHFVIDEDDPLKYGFKLG